LAHSGDENGDGTPAQDSLRPGRPCTAFEGRSTAPAGMML
jgi:hypothetical protein